jgi:hypothetical protein
MKYAASNESDLISAEEAAKSVDNMHKVFDALLSEMRESFSNT